jgi:hypothetical protein
MVDRAARAACETVKSGRCLFPNCFCEEDARRAIVVALEAALNGKEE